MSHRVKPSIHPDSSLTKEPQPQLNKRYSCYRNVPSANQDCLAKCFPKYCQRLRIQSNSTDWLALKNIKRVRTLHHLEVDMKIEDYDFSKAKKPTQLLRKLLQNKRKSMKSLPIVNNQLSLELGMLLPGIKTLDLSSKWRYSLFGLEKKLQGSEKKIWRFYKRFWMFCRDLEHVRMLEYDDDLPLLIQGLKKHHKVLVSLRTFALGFETPKEYFSFLLVRQVFAQNLSALSSFKSSTDFKLNEEGTPLSISLLLFCSKASQLSIQIGNNISKEYVAILQKSGTLTVKVWDPELFISQKEFTKSLEKVSQAISHYGKMSRDYIPTHFRALELHLENFFNEEFLSSILKEELTIKSLVLKFSFKNRRRSYYQLAPTLDTLSSFKSLKHLTILDESKEEYKNMAFNLKHALEKVPSLSQLTSFNIDCLIQEASVFEDFFSVFLADQQEPKNISCSKIAFSSVQSLTELFQTLNNYESLTESNASFKIHLRVRRIEDALRDFEYSLTLQQKIPVEIMIDSHAGSIISQDKSEQIIDHLQTIFPQFEVTNNLPSDIFELKNLIV